MRMNRLLALSATIAAVAVAVPRPASAFGDEFGGLWPGGPDPYAYRYERRSYYPYYGSNLWRPAQEMRYRYRYPLALPEYSSSWGYPLPCQVVWDKTCRSDVPRRHK